MSTRSTLLLANCCHIYHDYFRFEDGAVDMDREILVIDVHYGCANEYGEGLIEVEWDSDFAAMIRMTIQMFTPEVLEAFCRKHWESKQK